MTEAKKLDSPISAGPTTGPTLTAVRTQGPEVFAGEAHAVQDAELAGISQGPVALSGEATLLESPLHSLSLSAGRSGQASFGRRLATHLLIFLLLGLATFTLGAAAAWGLVTGALDSHTPQLKETMLHAKELLHSLTGH